MKQTQYSKLLFYAYTAFLMIIVTTAIIIFIISTFTDTITVILSGIALISFFIYIPVSFIIKKKEYENLLKINHIGVL